MKNRHGTILREKIRRKRVTRFCRTSYRSRDIPSRRRRVAQRAGPRAPCIFRSDFLENEAACVKILLCVFDSIFHGESTGTVIHRRTEQFPPGDFLYEHGVEYSAGKECNLRSRNEERTKKELIHCCAANGICNSNVRGA